MGQRDCWREPQPQARLSFYLKTIFSLAALGLPCCKQAFSDCSEQGLFSSCSGFSRGARPLRSRLSDCGTQVKLPHSRWNLPRPGIEHMSSALADRPPTPGPPGKSCNLHFKTQVMRTTPSSFIYSAIIY